jgi:hypothetical protein
VRNYFYNDQAKSKLFRTTKQIEKIKRAEVFGGNFSQTPYVETVSTIFLFLLVDKFTEKKLIDIEKKVKSFSYLLYFCAFVYLCLKSLIANVIFSYTEFS